MRDLIDAGLPVLIPVAMLAVGLELTADDLLRVLHTPGRMAVALVGQIVVLPLVALVLIVGLHPPAAVVGGLILVAAAPQALSSNYFCLLARADMALSVTLTAVSSMMAVVATPLVANIMLEAVAGGQDAFALPAAAVARQILTGLLLPVTAGMLLRRFAAGAVARQRARVQRASMAFAATMVILLLVDQAGVIRDNLWAIVLAATLFTLAGAALGWGLARAAGWDRGGRMTLAAAFPSRSLSVATLIALNVLRRPEFLSFATVFFLVQTLLLAPLMFLGRPTGARRAAA